MTRIAWRVLLHWRSIFFKSDSPIIRRKPSRSQTSQQRKTDPVDFRHRGQWSRLNRIVGEGLLALNKVYLKEPQQSSFGDTVILNGSVRSVGRSAWSLL